jgi:Mrp family chromosome partitioning ATPase/capsular polysaccharide biosynthesis protein
LSLRDYLRVLREQRLVIVVVAVIFAAGAYALSAQQTSVYQAQSSVVIQDPAQVQAQLGNPVFQPFTEQQLAQRNAQNLTRPAVVNRVRQLLGPGVSPSAITDVGAFVEVSTGNVVIQANSTNRFFAAKLANAYAIAVQETTRNELVGDLQSQAKALRDQFNRLRATARDPVTRAIYGSRIAALDAAAQFANPVSIQARAGVPATPVSPRPVRNTILGFLLGLTVGVLAAFGRDALDRRLRDASEITDELGWPILGQVREEALGSPGLTASNGRGPMNQVDFESFRILRQNLQFLNLDKPPRSVVVTSAMPEEGKSTVALSLASASALAGKSTLLVECDLRRPSLAKKLALEPAPGLTDFLLGQATPQETLRTIALTEPAGTSPSSRESPTAATHGESDVAHPQLTQTPAQPWASAIGSEPRLVCILAGSRTAHAAELLASERFKSFLTDVMAAYDMVVLDSCPLLSVADTLELLPLAEGGLMCVRATKTTRDEIEAAKQAIGRLPELPMGVVVTGVRPGSESDFGYYAYPYADRS